MAKPLEQHPSPISVSGEGRCRTLSAIADHTLDPWQDIWLAWRRGEKERLLDHLVASGGRLFFSRDPDVAMIKVMRDRQARYVSFDQYASLSRFDA